MILLLSIGLAVLLCTAVPALAQVRDDGPLPAPPAQGDKPST